MGKYPQFDNDMINEHPLEWFSKNTGHILLNWMEIPFDMESETWLLLEKRNEAERKRIDERITRRLDGMILDRS